MSLTVFVLVIISGKFTEPVVLGQSLFDQRCDNKLTSKQSMPCLVFCHRHNFQVTNFILGLLNYILFQCILSYTRCTWMKVIN